MSAGEEVTEVKPAEEDWTIVETPDGTIGKVPTNFISWKTPGEHKNPKTLHAVSINLNHMLLVSHPALKIS